MPMTLDGQQVFIQSARFLGRFPQKRTPVYLVLGQDGGQSVPIDGGVLFFFSDTLLLASDRRAASVHPAPIPVPSSLQSVFLANCAAVSESRNLEPALAGLRYFLDEDGLPREIVKPTEREQFRRLRFWPEHGVLVDGRVYFYYLGVQTTDPSSIWGFRTLGVGVAAIDPVTGGCERFQHHDDWIFWRNAGEDFHFGVQVLIEDYVYVFGSVRSGVQSEATLARVQLNRIADRDAYEYLVSPAGAWTRRFEEACTLGPSAAAYSVSFNPYLGRYTMWLVDEYRKRLMLRTAQNIWGPYSDSVDLIGLPHAPSSLLVFLGFEHPLFQQQNGSKIFLSYCEPHFASSSLVTLTLGAR
jgi:hypothetical protein